MQKKSYEAVRYTKANPYHMINVWAAPEKREQIIKQRLLTDKSFKLTSLQVNPLYKPVFDKLDAVAQKELNQLDKSVLWSRKYRKADFNHFFLQPAIIWIVIIFLSINYGVKYRLYANYIRHERRLGMSDNLGLDLDDVENYPPSVFELWKEKQAYDAHIKRKDEKISKIEDNFHKYAESRLKNLAEQRAKRGLRTMSQ